MKNTIIIFILVIICTFSGCAKHDIVIEANWQGEANEAFFARIIDKYNYSSIGYFDENEIVAYDKIINYFMLGACLDENYNTYSNMKKYESKPGTFVVPSAVVEPYLTTRFNTKVNRENISSYNKSDSTYTFVFTAGDRHSSDEILTVNSLDLDKYEVVLMNRVLIKNSSLLTIYSKFTFEIKNDEYKFLSVQKMTDAEIDYTIENSAYNENNIHINYPVLSSIDGTRDEYFSKKNIEILNLIKEKLDRAYKDIAFDELYLDYEITYSDYYLISVKFSGHVKLSDTEKKQDIMHTLTLETVVSSTGYLNTFFDCMNDSFVTIFKDKLLEQAPKEAMESYNSYTLEDYKCILSSFEVAEDGYVKSLVEFNITNENLILYIPDIQKNDAFLKITLPLSLIDNFKLY